MIYAIGTQEFVELRESSKPPSVSTKILSKTLRIRDQDYWWMHESPRYRTVTDKVKITTVRGGSRIVDPIKRRTFQKWTGHLLQPGTLWPLPVKMSDEILKKVEESKSEEATGRP